MDNIRIKFEMFRHFTMLIIESNITNLTAVNETIMNEIVNQ